MFSDFAVSPLVLSVLFIVLILFGAILLFLFMVLGITKVRVGNTVYYCVKGAGP